MYACMHVSMYTVCVRSVSCHQATNSDDAFDKHTCVCTMYACMYVCIQRVFLASVGITPQTATTLLTNTCSYVYVYRCVCMYACMHIYSVCS